MRRVGKKQKLLISKVLLAVAELEGWDAEHPSIAVAPDGGWQFLNGSPVPSVELLKRVKELLNGG
jgi:hypothetical protein